MLSCFRICSLCLREQNCLWVQRDWECDSERDTKLHQICCTINAKPWHVRRCGQMGHWLKWATREDKPNTRTLFASIGMWYPAPRWITRQSMPVQRCTVVWTLATVDPIEACSQALNKADYLGVDLYLPAIQHGGQIIGLIVFWLYPIPH